MADRRIVIAGGSGYLGQRLAAGWCAAGEQVVILSRGGRPPPHGEARRWDGARLGDWCRALDGADALVNLSGASIATAWDDDRRRAIRLSRLQSTFTLGRAIAACAAPPSVWINASGVAAYPDDGRPQAEGGPQDAGGFLAQVVREWERVFSDAARPGVRQVALRTAIVLGNEPGSAADPLRRLTWWGLGGQQGDGRQGVSWIHLEDYCAAVDHLLGSSLRGPVNAAAPGPVSNRAFMAGWRRAMRRPWSPPAPTPLLRLAGRLFGPDADLLIRGALAYPQRLLDDGFRFRYDDWPRAAGVLVGQG